MSRKLSVVLVGVFASVALAAGFMQGCGGGSSSNSNVALCDKVCDKALECAPDAGQIGQQAHGDCIARCAAAGHTTCSNESEIVSAANACLALSCDQISTCRVPDCQTTTGTGGTTGTAAAPAPAVAPAPAGRAAPPIAPSARKPTRAARRSRTDRERTALSPRAATTWAARTSRTLATCQAVLTTAHNVPDPPPACLQ